MSGEILTTIITILSIFGFMYRQTALLSAETKGVRAELAAVDKRQSERLSAEIKEVREDIAAVDKRLSHTDGLVEGLSRALLSTQAPAQTQAQALA